MILFGVSGSELPEDDGFSSLINSFRFRSFTTLWFYPKMWTRILWCPVFYFVLCVLLVVVVVFILGRGGWRWGYMLTFCQKKSMNILIFLVATTYLQHGRWNTTSLSDCKHYRNINEPVLNQTTSKWIHTCDHECICGFGEKKLYSALCKSSYHTRLWKAALLGI